jgi:hypothetical protein
MQASHRRREVATVSAQTTQTTLEGDVAETEYSGADLSGLAFQFWLSARLAPDAASDRDIATVAVEAHETDAVVRDLWASYEVKR